MSIEVIRQTLNAITEDSLASLDLIDQYTAKKYLEWIKHSIFLMTHDPKAQSAPAILVTNLNWLLDNCTLPETVSESLLGRWVIAVEYTRAINYHRCYVYA